MGGSEVRVVNLSDHWKPVHQPASFSGKQQSLVNKKSCCVQEISPQARGGKLEKVDQEVIEAVAHLSPSLYVIVY